MKTVSARSFPPRTCKLRSYQPRTYRLRQLRDASILLFTGAHVVTGCQSERPTFGTRNQATPSDDTGADAASANDTGTSDPSDQFSAGQSVGPNPSFTSADNGTLQTSGVRTDPSAATSTTATTTPQQLTPAGTADVTSPSTSEPTGPGGEVDCTQLECCQPNDCSAGNSCVDGQCECNQGTKRCGDECIADTLCCDNKDCPAQGMCADGMCTCPENTHLCDSGCVSNLSPNSCGGACEACPSPTGGESGCNGEQCTAVCPDGQKVCVGTCIDAADPCDAACPDGSHDCSGVCVQNTSPLACGDSCTPCTVPPNADATCDGEACDFACKPSFKECNEKCIANTACCEDSECSGGMTCDAGTCKCGADEKRCDDTCVPSSGCCGDNECPAGQGCKENTCTDVLAPRVTAISPVDGETGVAEDATIRITFSEKMNQDAVESGLTLSSVSSNQMSLSWDSAGTTLTIALTQGNKFQYAEGTSQAATTARSYDLTIAQTASDLVGNRLSAAFEANFSTLRRITETLPPLGVATNQSYDPDAKYECHDETTNVGVGWWSGSSAGGTYYVYASFDALQLAPFPSVNKLESAAFIAEQEPPGDGFYDDGTIELEKVEYLDVTARGFSLSLQEVTETLGTFSTSAAVNLSKDITTSFWSDWGSGHEKQLFRLHHGGNPPNAVGATMTCEGFGIAVKYLLP